MISAPGTGKTLTALWITEALRPSLVVVFAPALSLVKQTLDSWRAHAAAPFDLQVVCSDDSIADDIPPSALAGLEPVTTDIAECAAFLTASHQRMRVVFATYQSAHVVSAAILDADAHADLLVCDEAHRLVGADDKAFQIVLDESAVPTTRRLFLTATPRVVYPHARLDADATVVSMDDASLFGDVAYKLTFGGAIALGLLAEYRLDVLTVAEQDVQHHMNADPSGVGVMAEAVAVARALASGQFRRAFSFHHTKAAATAFHSAMQVAERVERRGAGAPWALSTVFGVDPVATRMERLEHLVSAPAGLIASVRTLSEGVDVPALDAVVFVDPKQSVVEVCQAVGRALRRDPANPDKMAHIVVPVFVGPADGMDVALADDRWEPVWRTLAALAANDERLAAELTLAARARGRFGLAPISDGLIEDRFERAITRALHLTLPPTVTLGRLRKTVAVRALDELADPWEIAFGRVEAYVARTDSADMPVSYVDEDGFRLGAWVSAQRSAFAEDRIARDRIAALDEVPGWSWGRWDQGFAGGFAALQRFVERAGHARIGMSSWDELSCTWISEWVAALWPKYEKGRIAPVRARQLAALPGWSWQRAAWLAKHIAPSFHTDMARLEEIAEEIDVPYPEPPAAVREHEYSTGKLGHLWRNEPLHPLVTWYVHEWLPRLLTHFGMRLMAREVRTDLTKLATRGDLHSNDERQLRSWNREVERVAQMECDLLRPRETCAIPRDAVADMLKNRVWSAHLTDLVKSFTSSGSGYYGASAVYEARELAVRVIWLGVLREFGRTTPIPRESVALAKETAELLRANIDPFSDEADAHAAHLEASNPVRTKRRFRVTKGNSLVGGFMTAAGLNLRARRLRTALRAARRVGGLDWRIDKLAPSETALQQFSYVRNFVEPPDPRPTVRDWLASAREADLTKVAESVRVAMGAAWLDAPLVVRWAEQRAFTLALEPPDVMLLAASDRSKYQVVLTVPRGALFAMRRARRLKHQDKKEVLAVFPIERLLNGTMRAHAVWLAARTKWQVELLAGTVVLRGNEVLTETSDTSVPTNPETPWPSGKWARIEALIVPMMAPWPHSIRLKADSEL